MNSIFSKLLVNTETPAGAGEPLGAPEARLSTCLPPSCLVIQVWGLPGQFADCLDLGTPFSFIVLVSLSVKHLEEISCDSFQL